MLPASRKKLESIAYHEAGHAIAAWRFNIPFGKGKYALSIIADETSLGHCANANTLRGRSLDVETTDSDRLKMERIVGVCLAGVVAQRRFKSSSVRSWHGSSDYHSAVSLVSRFTASDRETEIYLKLLTIRTELMLARPGSWECVKALAAELLDKKALSAEETIKIIQATHARLVEDHYKSLGLPSPSKVIGSTIGPIETS